VSIENLSLHDVFGRTGVGIRLDIARRAGARADGCGKEVRGRTDRGEAARGEWLQGQGATIQGVCRRWSLAGDTNVRAAADSAVS